jgi:hypothetical protein
LGHDISVRPSPLADRPESQFMHLRYVLPLLVAAALAFAYAAPLPSHPFERVSRREVVGDTIVGALDVTLGDEVEFNFRVTNSSSRKVELRFPNGQTHDVAVFDAQGREVWRWSRGRMFTQAIQNRNLRAADTLTFTERWRPSRPGRYTAVAKLLSENFPTEDRASFSLPPHVTAKR